MIRRLAARAGESPAAPIERASSRWRLCGCAALMLSAAGTGCMDAQRAGDASQGMDWRRIATDPGEYAVYRRVRAAPSFERRLLAGWEYLRSFPDGAFRAEVRAWFEVAEERYRRRAWDSRERLYAYVELLPDGPHVGAVRRRIFMLEQRARSDAAEQASFMRRERERQAAFDRAKESRLEFRKALVRWLQRLGQLRAFGTPRTDWDPEFQRAMFQLEPPATCDERGCEKVLRYEYELPSSEGLQTQSSPLTVRLSLADGRLVEAEIAGFGLFNSLAESVSLERVKLDDLQARAEAIGTAVQVVETAAESSFPHERCGAEAVSPVVLLRRCDGQQLEMITGEGLESPDRIVWTPLGAGAQRPPKAPR